MKKTLFSLTLIMFYLVSFQFVDARSEMGVTNTLIKFKANRDAGKNAIVTVENKGDEELVIDFSKADFVIGTDGAFQVKEAGYCRHSAADMIGFDVKRAVLAAGAKKSVKVYLKKDIQVLDPPYNCAIMVRYSTKNNNPAVLKVFGQIAVKVIVER